MHYSTSFRPPIIAFIVLNEIFVSFSNFLQHPITRLRYYQSQQLDSQLHSPKFGFSKSIYSLILTKTFINKILLFFLIIHKSVAFSASLNTSDKSGIAFLCIGS